ncbi:MAG: COX15/CtaA family protein [Methylobacteriaceae bacterium]|nr:COX15/CtaA family protein [Methylobacteriaceae bacterium]
MSVIGVMPEPVAWMRAGPVRDRAAIRLWLWGMVALVFAMVLVGGATRLTESGLSITEWKPVTGVLPPLSPADWAAEFEKYKRIPQYAQMNPDMTLAQFRTIYFWEWGHRLLGRLIGLAFALPLAVFWLRGALSTRLKWQLSGVLALGALQGAVGWWMVASGLVGRVEVAQERLAVHLLLASLTLMALTWIAVGLRAPADAAAERAARPARWSARALLWLILVQIGLGALVAGLRAGLVYDTWPLMDGRLVPPFDHLARLAPLWANLVDNPTMVQFQHRMIGYLVALLAFVHALHAFRLQRGRPPCKRAVGLWLMILAQIGLGAATLLGHVQIHVALAHQGLAMAILIMATAHLRRLG